MLDSSREDAVARLRSLLDAHGYARPEATEALGAPIGPEHRAADLPLYLRRLAAPRPLHTLIKLFALHAPVPEADARAAFGPLSIEELAALGLVERAEEARSGRSSRWRWRRGSSWPVTAPTRSRSPSSRTTCSGWARPRSSWRVSPFAQRPGASSTWAAAGACRRSSPRATRRAWWGST